MNVVLIPRGGSWGASVAAEAADLGLTPWVLPLIETIPTPSVALTVAHARLAAGEYDWLAVTSAAAVPALLRGSVPARTRVAAVGAASAAALQAVGIAVDLVGQGGAEDLVRAWPREACGRVLAVQSDHARSVLADGLTEAGYDVDAVVAYRTAATTLSESEARAVRDGKADIALVTSGSIARRLAELDVADSTRLIAMGAQTAADTRAAGLSPAAVAASPTIPDVLKAGLEAL